MLLAAVSGCGSAAPSEAERLARREKQRETESLGKSQTTAEQFAAAGREFKSKNYTNAQKILRKLLLTEPGNIDAIFLSARTQAASGDFLGAAELVVAIPEDHPELGRVAMEQRVKWLVKAGYYDEAIDGQQRMIEVHGQTRRSIHELARMLNNVGRRVDAAKHLKALARQGDVTEKELFALITLSMPFIDATMTKPDFESRLTPAALAKAKELREQDKLHESRELIEKLNRRYPTSTRISAFMGRVYAELEADDRMVKWLSALPDGIEQEPEYWHALGSLLQRQQQHEQAVRCFAEALFRDETDRFSLLAMARSLEILGQREQADHAMHRFRLMDETSRLIREFSIQPGSAEQVNRLADILAELYRPFESLEWRLIAVQRSGMVQKDIDALVARRESLLREPEPVPQLWRTCGVDLSAANSPSIADVNVPSHNDPANNDPGENTPAESAAPRPLKLVNVAKAAQLTFQYVNGDDPTDNEFLIHHLVGGGIGVVDFDNDGWQDLYFAQAGGPEMDPNGSQPNQLFRNLDGQSYTNITAATKTGDRGYGQGVCVADINQDGFPDLLAANIGRNILFINNGDGSFRKLTLSTNDDGHWTTSIACGDLSGDHLPEIVDVNYSDDAEIFRIPCRTGHTECAPFYFAPSADQVFSVQVDGKIEPWDKGAKFADWLGHGFAAVISNIDGLHGNDLFIVNDTDDNHYWRSQKASNGADGYELIEAGVIAGCANGFRGARRGCMGLAHGDFDHNGLIDFHVTNFRKEPSDLYLQQSHSIFSNPAATYRLDKPTAKPVGWGTQAIDVDRDGWLELAVLNGHIVDNRIHGIPFQMRPLLFRGRPNRFELVSDNPGGDRYWMAQTLGRTMAIIDWNRDGKIDLLAGHLDVPVALLENQTDTHHWLQLELIGTASERDAIGAEIQVRTADQQWTGWVVGGDGFLCSNEAVVDFGIGSHESVAELRVKWPTGETQIFQDLASDQRYLIVEGEETVFARESMTAK